MSKLKLIKSIRFCERWGSINPVYKEGATVMGANIPSLEYFFISRGFTRKLSIYESGIGGKNRIVEVDGQGESDPIIGDNFSSKVAKYLSPIEYLKKDFDKLAWLKSEYGDDAFLFQYLATQAAILRREKVWFGTSNQSTIWTDSGMNDKTLSEWWGGDITKKTEFLSEKNLIEGSINETDLKWRKKYNLPPYFEIIQDPYVEPVDDLGKNKLRLRSFGGSDPYFLNNGSRIVIEWSKSNGDFVGGDNYSDNWQREMNGDDIGETSLSSISKKITIWGPSSSFTIAQQVNDSGSKDIGFLDQKEVNYQDIRKKDFKGLYDDDIIKQVVDKWRLVYSNEKLALTERWDYYGNIKPTLDFISPVLSTISGTGPSASLITTSASVITGATGVTGATGASASRIHGSYIFDVTKTGYLINIELGELTILEKESIEDPFIANNFEQTDDYGNAVQLSSEYIENEFNGIEESIIEEQEYASEEEKLETEKQSDMINSEPYVPGKYKLDLVPGEFLDNKKVPIKCCQINSKPVPIKIAEPLLDLIQAAKKDGINLIVNSGFRPGFGDNVNTKSEAGVKVTADSQEALYAKFLKNGSPDTAKAGTSKHGYGLAIDFNTGTRTGASGISVMNSTTEKNYQWLVKNSWRFGYIRGVATEEWHYEYLPDLAKKGPYARIPKNNKLYYKDLGLNDLKLS